MARFIPPPRMRPVAGYASTTEAVMAMVEQGGKKPRQIADELGTTVETVRGIIQRARTERRTTGINGLPPDRAAGLRELYRRILAMVSEARDVDEETLHALFRGTHITNTNPDRLEPSPQDPAGDGADSPSDPIAAPEPGSIPPPASEPEAEEVTLTSVTSSVPKPTSAPRETRPVLISKTMQPEPLLGSQVHLKNRDTGAYLHQSCEIMTMDKAQRWKGTPTQALACKRKFDIASALSMVRAEPPAPKLNF